MHLSFHSWYLAFQCLGYCLRSHIYIYIYSQHSIPGCQWHKPQKQHGRFNSNSDSLNISILSFSCFYLMSKEHSYQRAKWPQLSWKELGSAECAKSGKSQVKKWTNIKIRKISHIWLISVLIGSTNTRSHQAGCDTGESHEARPKAHVQAFGEVAQMKQEHCFGLKKTHHLPDSHKCSLFPLP